eukprot:472448_1
MVSFTHLLTLSQLILVIGYQSSELLYIHVTNLICYLAPGIEFNCKTNGRVISTKIFLLAGMNLMYQIEKYFCTHLFFEYICGIIITELTPLDIQMYISYHVLL